MLSPSAKVPMLRARVAVPLALLTLAGIAMYLTFGRVDPFETVRPPPATDWVPEDEDEVTGWAWNEGMNSYVQGEYEDAATTLGRAAGAMSSRPEPQFYAGVSNLMCERGDAAEIFLQRAVDLEPEEPKYRFFLALAHHAQGDDEAAALHLAAAATADGTWARQARGLSKRLR